MPGGEGQGVGHRDVGRRLVTGGLERVVVIIVTVILLSLK